MHLTRPLDLPRLLLRGSAAVSLGALLLATLVGLWRAGEDIEDEMQAAMALATALQRLVQAASLDDAALVQALRAQSDDTPLRHLALSLRDADGRLQLGRRAPAAASAPIEWLVDLHRRWYRSNEPPPLAWQLPRPDGSVWTLVLSPTPDSERREAVASLLQTLAVLAAGAALLLVLMAWQLRRALQPMQALLQAIARLRAGEADAAARLPAMPVHELQAIVDGLRELDQALQSAAAQRRLLAQRLHTLQEDERRHLAQELHDELGQRLTALRLDATVLQRQLQGDAAALAQGLALQADAAQQEVRALLARLAPRSNTWVPPQRLQELLQTLAAAQRGLSVQLDCEPGTSALPQTLLLAVYRISQEGLTNIGRHAQAQHARLRVWREGTALHWLLQDDGIGLPDPAAALARGSGLAGVRERVWAFGGDLQWFDACPGLGLRATLWPPPDNAAP